MTSTTSNIDAMEQRAIVQPIRILNGLLVDRTPPISINLAGSHFSIAVFDNDGIEIYYASSIQYDRSADNNDSAVTIVRDFQNFGVPSFIDATGNPFAAGFAFSYGKGSRVRFNDLNYVSLVDDNRAVPGDARLIEIGSVLSTSSPLSILIGWTIARCSIASMLLVVDVTGT